MSERERQSVRSLGARWLRAASGDGTVRAVAEAFGWGLLGGPRAPHRRAPELRLVHDVTRARAHDGVRGGRARSARSPSTSSRRPSSPPTQGDTVGFGLLAGAAGVLPRRRGHRPHRRRATASARAATRREDSPFGIVLGAVLDGIPESIVLGATLLTGEGVSTAFVAAVFISNLPEGLAGSTGLPRAGWSRPAHRRALDARRAGVSRPSAASATSRWTARHRRSPPSRSPSPAAPCSRCSPTR